MEAFIRGSASIALIAAAIYQRDPSWWLYVPSYALAAVVCFWPLPNNTIWRFLSALAVTGGGLFMLFLWWTITGLEKHNVEYQPTEAKNLFPVSVGVALCCLTRLSSDSITKPTHYIRSLIHVTLLALSVTLIASTGKYYRY